MRALIIDDSRAIRLILSRQMGELGIEAEQAENGVKALELLEQGQEFDFALVDWNMPEMNGFEFVQAVRAQERWNDMKLMMVTTETEMSQVVKALGAGANEYVMKPFTREVITEKLALLGLRLPAA
ncbi:MAG: response regulator [Planctomycetota bacterium]|jgi:two-component system chemotaxis response regulator CheY